MPKLVALTSFIPVNWIIERFICFSPGRPLTNRLKSGGVSIVTNNSAVLPASSLDQSGDRLWYLKANPGRNVRSMNPFISAGIEPHHIG